MTDILGTFSAEPISSTPGSLRALSKGEGDSFTRTILPTSSSDDGGIENGGGDDDDDVDDDDDAGLRELVIMAWWAW